MTWRMPSICRQGTYPHRLASNGFAEATGKGLLVDDIDLHAEQVAQVHEQAALIQKGAPGLEADEHVQVGGFGGVAAGDGAEDADVRGAVFSRHVHDLAPPTDNLVLRDHVTMVSE